MKDHRNNENIDEQETSEFINEFFSNVGENLASKLTTPWSYLGNECNQPMRNIQPTLEEVSALIKEIDTSKSSAIDYLSSRVMKDAFTVIPSVLLHIFRSSLDTGVIPRSWKKATIIPLKKCGNSNEVSNLRPISLLPMQGKMLEKIIHNRLLLHLEGNNLLDERQGGFRPNHSTIDAIVKFSETIYKGINEGKITVATYIDLKKAFDTVNHVILLQKLEKMGLNKFNITWIKNYLTDRSQATLANGVLSSERQITCGVPQGSVLGPLLFLIYVNDLGSVLSTSQHFLYADDTVILQSGDNISDIVELLQIDLNNYGSWCKANKLTINTKKSNYVIYGTNQKTSRIRQCDLSLCDETLIRTHNYKYLGVYLDSHLNFNVHIDNCCKIVSHKFYLLSKIRRNITQSTCARVFKSMIAPLMDYVDIIYSGSSDLKLSRIQKLQNRGLRICFDGPGYMSRVQLHQIYRILPLKIRRKYNLRKYMFKQKENPELVVHRDIRTRRYGAVVFETDRPNLQIYKKGAIYRGVEEWNNLPVEIRNIESFIAFKGNQKEEMYDILPFLNGSHI